jgi:homogentisate 1,2-dioxygenase
MSAKKWINFPILEGETSRQAHCDFPEDTYERELGREGFFGPVSHMHHQNPPTAWIDWEGPLRPRAFDFNKTPGGHPSPYDAPVMLENNNLAVRLWKSDHDMAHLVRNSDGDELLFIHYGSGELYCDYGHLSFRDGDYLMIPRGTAWRIEVTDPLTVLMMENKDAAYSLPERGILGPNAVYDPAILDYPRLDSAFKAQQGNDTWQVHIKRLNQISKVTFPFNPLDAVGWHGDNTVVRLNWRDIRPLMSHRYHLPPSAHSTFVGNGFIVCTFCPRPIESDPGALKVPFFHNNDDYDEVLFYHRGDFFSRDNIEEGMVTFHPCGFAHGPHPKALQKALSNPKKETDEVAVMIDTRYSLQVTEVAEKTENQDYIDSWKSPGKDV